RTLAARARFRAVAPSRRGIARPALARGARRPCIGVARCVRDRCVGARRARAGAPARLCRPRIDSARARHPRCRRRRGASVRLASRIRTARLGHRGDRVPRARVRRRALARRRRRHRRRAVSPRARPEALFVRQPPRPLDRYVLLAAALTLFFLFLRHPGWALGLSLAAIGVEVLLVHTSTAVFLGVPLLGFAAARVLLTRTDLRSSATALAALFLPAGAALAWLLPLVRETASHSPSSRELERALTKYADELNVDSLHHYALRPEVVSRGGAV